LFGVECGWTRVEGASACAAMASVVLLVTFPVRRELGILLRVSSDGCAEQENPEIRQRGIVVRADGSSAAELVSKIMSKSGMTGVGYLTIQMGKDDPERALAPKEDVFALAAQAVSAKDVVLAFHNARPGDEPPRRALPARGTGGGGDEGWSAGAGAAADTRTLAERVAEQEKLINQLKAIEREQQKIIDSQVRAADVLSPRSAGAAGGGGGGGGGQSLGAALERDKLEMALEEERRQNAFNRRELERLRAQKAEYGKLLRQAGVEPPPASRTAGDYDDHAEEVAGCNTRVCVVS
jgi:hypothetical protein